MSLRERTRSGLGTVEPCLPSPAKSPPSGPGWLHEIKHDGFRIMALKSLPVRSYMIDGEAIVCDENGLADFELIRGHRTADAVHCAFDLLELDGRDLRRRPIEERMGLLTQLLHGSNLSIVLNQHYEGDGAI